MHAGVLVVLALASYSNTLDAPFELDDYPYIVGNPAVKDPAYILEPHTASNLNQYPAVRARPAGYAAFALNYFMGGLDVRGFHVFNISVHALNSILAYLLIRLLITSIYPSHKLDANLTLASFFGGAIFAVHPVQTEAVTYIYQRMASMAALFYMLSFFLYLKHGTAQRGKAFLYCLSLISALIAFKTKENTATLPFVLLIYELSFGGGKSIKRFLGIIPFFALASVIPLSMAGSDWTLGSASPLLRGHEGFTHYEYFLTGLRVIVTYMRLLVFPIGQNVIYDYLLYTSLLHPAVLSSALLHITLISLSVYAIRVRKERLMLPAFGVLWFYITLSMESLIIPLPMLINEYRVYLPSFGVFLAVASILYGIKGHVRIATAVLIAIVLSLSFAAYQRNWVWRSEVSFWQDIADKSPDNPRLKNNLGYVYFKNGDIENAVTQYNSALSIDPSDAYALSNLGLAYYASGRLDKAVEKYEHALRIDPDIIEAHSGLASAYIKKGDLASAEAHYKHALQLDPAYSGARLGLALLYIDMGRYTDAEAELKTALRYEPDSIAAKKYLSYLKGVRR